jgi:NADPH2:quinone reductase
MEITKGEGCKAVIDGIGKNTMDISIESLARRGIFVRHGVGAARQTRQPRLTLTYHSNFSANLSC